MSPASRSLPLKRTEAPAPARRRCALLCGLALLLTRPAVAAETDWDLAPYRVHVTVAVDTALRPQPALDGALRTSIAHRIAGSVSPLWVATVTAPADAAVRAACFSDLPPDVNELPPEWREFDKLIWLGVEATATGYQLRAREFDAHLQLAGEVQTRFTPQGAYLPEACFALIASVFRPLALIDPIADDESQVRLRFKGAGLPRRDADALFVRPGDVLQPLLRRTDRSGRLAEGGVTPTPWTFLTAVPADGGGWRAAVHTGTRRPFAMQRRGRVEQLALALRRPPGPTEVRFHARSDAAQSLAGYEVFRVAPDGTQTPLGVTDRRGVISVPPPDEGAITTVMLRSDGQVLAKLPVPSGGGPALEIPVADSVARLRAQAESQVVREQLVDVVARRAIIMARIRAYLQKNRIEDARKLMAELDALPTSSIFGRNIQQAAKKIPASKDPLVQRNIDKMFSTTRELLGNFLDRRPVTDLQSQINAAADKPPVPDDAPG